MTSYEKYKAELDYIEDDVGLHAFNLKDRDGTPPDLKEKVEAFIKAEKELKRALVQHDIHLRNDVLRERWL